MRVSALAAAMAILGCVALPAAASESFTLDIPVRGDASQEIGLVRIELTLDGPAAGAQLVVNGSTTLNLGDALPVNADFVRFTGVGNGVSIEYEPRSNFSPDFCGGGSAVPKSIPLRFAGAQDVTEYRMSSFVVAAPAVECSRPSRRVAETPASITPAPDAVAAELVATYRGRLDLDVVLVLDKSGSMAAVPPGAVGGATKAEILRTAAKAFVAHWREVDQPMPDGGDASDDRLGVVFFDSVAAPQTLAGADPPANFFVRRGMDIPGAWQAVLNNIDTLAPGAATAIGGGINAAMQQWKADPLHDAALIVVTDGMQNTAPLIQPTASGFLGLAPVGGLPEELRKRFIPIQVIGFGEPAAVDEDLLRDISLETAGRSYIAINAATMFDKFALTLISILKGNTASLALRRSDVLPGAGPSAPQTVIVDRSVRRVVLSVQWAPPDANVLELEVFRPGASTPAIATSPQRLPQAVIHSFNVRPEDAGAWQVRVRRRRPDTDRASLPYSLHAFFLEGELDYRVTAEPARTRTGEPIRLRAEVSYGGKPLTRLPRGAVRVRVERPAEGIGAILRADRSTPKAATTAADAQTPLQRKVDALASERKLERARAKEVATITLVEKGRGVYVGTFDKTITPGSYGLEVLLDWDDARTGRIRRTDRIEHLVRLRADPRNTAVRMTRGADGTLLISVTPRDRFGNFLGPGHGSSIRAIVRSGGTLAAGEPVDRDLTGTYVFTVTDVPAGKTPRVEITVDGVKVTP